MKAEDGIAPGRSTRKRGAKAGDYEFMVRTTRKRASPLIMRA